jgi:hypothetical protein
MSQSRGGGLVHEASRSKLIRDMNVLGQTVSRRVSGKPIALLTSRAIKLAHKNVLNEQLKQWMQ